MLVVGYYCLVFLLVSKLINHFQSVMKMIKKIDNSVSTKLSFIWKQITIIILKLIVLSWKEKKF